MDWGWLSSACWWAGISIQRETTANQTVDLTNLKEVVKMTKKEEIDAFSSKIIHDQMKTMLLGNNMHALAQSLKEGDGSHLPHGLSVVNIYTKVIPGSKQVAVVMNNLMAILITIFKGIEVTKVLAANAVPQVKVVPRTLEVLDEVQGIQQTKMSVERRREVLFQQLDLSCLEEWPKENQVVAYTLLVEYPDIFSLEPGN